MTYIVKILTLILLCCSLNSTAQYEKRKKSKKQITNQALTFLGGTTFITAGTISMITKGEKPFVDNHTKWKTNPSEWAIILGITTITFGVIIKF